MNRFSGLLLLSILAGLTGCAVTLPPPEVGSTLSSNTASLQASVQDSLVTPDGTWKLLLTTSPTGSWGGEGRYGYHLVRVQGDSGRVAARVNLGEWLDQRIDHLSAGHGSLWLGLSGGGLIRVSTSANRIVDVIQVAQVPSWWMSEIPWTGTTADAVWLLVPGRGELFRVDPKTDRVREIPLNGGLGYYTGLRSDPDAVVVTCLRGNYHVDAATLDVTVIRR